MSKYSEAERARYCAFLHLDRRMHTKKELRDKLLKKEYSAEVIEDTLNYMEERHYIDDSDYARRYILDAVRFKKQGIRRIKMDLMRKGIDENTILDAVSELELDTDEMLKELVEKRAPKYDLEDKKQKDRFIGFLLRRGYKYDEIKNALYEYLNIESE